ncbi:MAG: hypothetical protein HFI64_00885 [Lachnospiraceae bacterium]|nr:hypothetical protein [Lachnospiraceae bacterium]
MVDFCRLLRDLRKWAYNVRERISDRCGLPEFFRSTCGTWDAGLVQKGQWTEPSGMSGGLRSSLRDGRRRKGGVS